MEDPSVMLQSGTSPVLHSAANASPQEIAQMIVRLFNEQGGSKYGGEQVTQVEHALQCAALAQRSGASTPLIVAALLHDIAIFCRLRQSSCPLRALTICMKSWQHTG